MMHTNTRESDVRVYCRLFPDLFQKAQNALLFSASGRKYIDFFAGAGALNLGHNPFFLKEKIMAHITSDGVIHALDMDTPAKRDFIHTFSEMILDPRKLDYKIQFCGPTGTDAVEAALKLARKVKQRAGIFSFIGAYHGMSLGSLSVTGNKSKRASAGIPLTHVNFMPYPTSFHPSLDSLEYIERVLQDDYSGVEKPAAIIFETVQAEGGVFVAPIDWMKQLRSLCDRHDILLICDEIQTGCYRTGSFFSFERANIIPDIVVLSKSISGYGLPMSLLLMKPELDIWKPGEHVGTFRANQLALVGAKAALEYAQKVQITGEVQKKEEFLKSYLHCEIQSLNNEIKIRGLGLMWGIDLSALGERCAADVASKCFELGLIIERCGRNATVLKILPPLTIEMDLLKKGCSMIKKAISFCNHQVKNPKRCNTETTQTIQDANGPRIFDERTHTGTGNCIDEVN